MSIPTNEANARPVTVADTTPQAETVRSGKVEAGHSRFGGLTVSTTALRGFTLLFALFAVWLFFQWATSGFGNPLEGTFLSARNFSNLMRQTAVTGTLAVGMLMLIVAGQIDLSIGSVVGLAGGVAALAQANGYDFVTTLLIAVAVGLAIGVLQGTLVAYANIPAFIVTLGGLLAWRGAIKGISQGSTVPIANSQFRAVGQDYLAPLAGYGLLAVAIAAIAYLAFKKARSGAKFGAPTNALSLMLSIAVPSLVVAGFIQYLNSYAGIPIPVLILLVVALAGAFITQNTTFGRYLYAIGGNPDAARLSGINLRGHTLAVFCIIGGLAGIASIIYTARVGAASPDAGTLLELDAIAACVIGGASLMGGRGTVLGACLGALFMASLDNGMSLMNVQDFYQDIVTGVILVLAVGLDMLGRKRG